MVPLKYRIALFLLLLCVQNTVSAESLNGKTVRVCYRDIPGMYFLDTNKQPTGYLVHVMTEILKKGGMTPVFEFYPLKRCFNRLRKGQADLMPAIGPSFVRKFFVDFTDTWVKSRTVFFYNKKNESLASSLEEPDDLEQLGKICGAAGANFGYLGFDNEDLDLSSRNLNMVSKKINSDRCGSFLAPWAMTLSMIAFGDYDIINDPKIGFKDIPGIDSRPISMAISKDLEWSEELIEFLNKESPQYGSQEKLTEIMNIYLPGFESDLKYR